MGIHYSYKNTRSAKLMEKQAKREKKLAEKKAKRLAKIGQKKEEDKDQDGLDDMDAFNGDRYEYIFHNFLRPVQVSEN